MGLGYLAVVSGAISYSVWMRGVGVLPATAISFLTLVVPVVAASIGWLALQQHLTSLQLLGMIIALGSLVAGQQVTRGRTATVRVEPSPRLLVVESE